MVDDRCILLAADHNGVELKKDMVRHLQEKGYNCIDLGPYESGVSVDYVDFAVQLGRIIANGQAKKGILICGTGVGMSVAVNKVPNVFGTLIHDLAFARKTKEHNDSRVACLGAWVNSPEVNMRIIDEWLDEPYGEGRHVKRIEKLKEHDREKIVFTNGIFDVLHTGHIELLRFAKNMGGKLIVGINSDRAVRQLKGPDRPLNDEMSRKSVLQAVEYVDEVVVFDDIETKGIMDQLRPDVLVKGGEWTADAVRERDRIPDYIDVKIFPIVKGKSTTGMIKSIIEKGTWQKCGTEKCSAPTENSPEENPEDDARAKDTQPSGAQMQGGPMCSAFGRRM